MKGDSYFQFPLCALSYGDDVSVRLNSIINYAVIQAGSKLFQRLTPDMQRHFIDMKRHDGAFPVGFNPNIPLHSALVYGADKLKVNFPHIKGPLDTHSKLKSYVSGGFESRHGRDAVVRIKAAWLFKTRDGNGLTYREFSVLCAIYSVLGDKKFSIVTRDRIRRCALGYRTEKIMTSDLHLRTDQAKPLTERQLRDTIDRLHRNKFFARATVARRFTYYSHRLDQKALRDEILKRRTYPAFFRATQAAQDQLLTNAIKQAKLNAAATSP